MLINTETQVRISEFDFKEAHPDSAFPAILTDDILEPYGVAVLNDGIQPVPSNSQKVIDGGNEFVNGQWQVKWALVDKTADEILAFNVEFQRLVTQLVQQRLDQFAQSRGYDDIVSACTYAGVPPDNATPTQLKFNTEGNYAVSIRSLTWAVLTDFMNEVKAGTKAMPSDYSEIEALLPELAWPN